MFLSQLFAVICLLPFIRSDIYSCGGFIQSAAPIDLSKVQIKLFTPEGHLKQEEDVNAQTGYYMMPVYTKAAYSLRVSAPEGWYFEPASFDFKIDGVNDVCSKNEDINFKLVAFQISGTVESSSGPGPVGLSLTLSQNGKEVARTKTSEDGHYSFKAAPGDYEVSAGSDSSVCFSREKTVVHVSDQPVKVTPSLEISGYELGLSVNNGGKPVEGVQLSMYSAGNPQLPGCKSVSALPAGVAGAKFVCPLAKTDKNGKVQVSCVPPGNYQVVSEFNQNGVEFQFEPSVLRLTMKSEKTTKSVSVAGFSATGRVESNGAGVSGVAVLVNGKTVATTDTKGEYRLTGLKEGKIEITAQSENTVFSKNSASLKLPTPALPAVTVTGYNLCGTAEVTQDTTKVSMIITNKKSGERSTATTDSSGKFCKSMPPAVYTVSPSDSASTLTPRQLDVDLTQGPRVDLRFTHFKTDMEVRVDCIGSCETLDVQLVLSGSVVHTERGNDVFQFRDISPGTYTVKVVDGGRMCWAVSEQIITVERSRPAPVQFEQTGFNTHVKLSHPAHLKWAHVDKKELRGELNGVAGKNTICMPIQGRYKISLSSCRSFDRPVLDIQVPSEVTAESNALDALIKGTVVVKDKADIKILVKSSSGERTVDIVNGVFSFQEPLTSSGKLVFVPQSDTHLFEPASVTVSFKGECIEKAAEFHAHKGLFVDGLITPPVVGVSIVAQHKKDSNVQFKTVSDASGKYRVGPVRRVEDLDISATMEGYQFNSAEGGRVGELRSVRLSKLTVAVSEIGDNGERLEGVLLSVVGGSYRSNNMLDKSGEKNFVGLAPGDYFLRPILQEFKFDPSQTTVNVKEGEHQHIDLKGRRVAWSAFGLVREMSGSAVRDAGVEALSEACDHHQSETTTNTDGSFRLLGLKPSCTYRVALKSGADGAPAPHCFPSQFTVKMTAEHVKNLEMVVAPSDEGFELLVDVDMKELSVPPQSVKLILRRDEEVLVQHSLVYPVHIFTLSNLTRDNSEYSIRIEADRTPQLFTSKEVTVVADRAVRAITIPLAPNKRHSDVEISYSSFLSLPFFALLAFMVFNQKKTKQFLDMVIGRNERSVSPSLAIKKRS